MYDKTAKVVMLKGDDAVSISNIEKKSTSGLTDTYEITLTDGTKRTFNVNNGKGIKSISKTSTSGLIDTYTITYNDDTTSIFTVKNGEKGDAGSVENLEVGGVNLLNGTNDGDSNWNFSSANGDITKSSKAFTKFGNVNGVRFDINENVSGWSFLAYSDPNIKNILSQSAGEKLTISFDVKSDVSSFIDIGVKNSNGTGTMIDFGSFDLEADKWRRCKLTSTVLQENIESQCVYIYTETLFRIAKYIEIANLKLEYGEVATYWTPSLEDIENTYATKSDVEQKNTSLSDRIDVLERDTGWGYLYRNSDESSYVKARQKNGVVYIEGSSGGTGIELKENTKTTVATLPRGYEPNEDIIFAFSMKGSIGYASGAIMADGKINLHSTTTTKYWGFCISYPL